jgi:SOS-response transcriptional repressor LexA
MTPKQKRILDFIRKFIAEKGYSPSYAEIGAALGYSSLATVFVHVQRLLKRGHLKQTHGGGRNLAPALKRKKLACDKCGCSVINCANCGSRVAA